MRRPTFLNILIAVLLGVISTVVSAWAAALLVDLDKPNEFKFQTALLHGDRVINVLRTDYDCAEVIVMRVCDEQSIPQRMSKSESELIRQIYSSFHDIEIIPVVNKHSNLELPSGSGAYIWVTSVLEVNAWPELRSDCYFVEQRFGWPWPVMYTTFCPNPGFSSWERVSGIRLTSLVDHTTVDPDFLPTERLLPLMPAVGPFTISSLMFGGIWLVILSVCRVIPITIRRMRGRCPDCAYDLRRKPEHGCPECGWNRPNGELQ